jgi:TatD DNase family protein
MLIDSHVHLDDPRFDPDRAEVFSRAQEAGIEAFVTIGCDLATSRAAVQLADQYPHVYATVGVHPHETRHIEDSWYEELGQLAKHPKVIAYGEIGLDYHYDHSPREIQKQRFREQIHLAKTLDLPVVIHTREAQEDTIHLLQQEEASAIGGVFHCFSGDDWLAKEALALDFYISFSGVITFQNAKPLREVVATIPLDRILVETDCPYLTPVPFRGKRNEPAHVKFVAETIQEIHLHQGPLSYETVATTTVANTKRLFKIP